MAKFVKNPSGTVHSVDDTFELPQLLGQESDPEVDFTELRDPAETVVDESGPAQEPGEPDERESNDIQPSLGGVIPAPEGVEATVEAGEVVTPEVAK
jgi:hypothetical protein